MSSDSKICYTWDENLIDQCDRLPAVVGRATLVHNLIAAYGLPEHMKVVRSTPASYEDLRLFHSELYLDHLKTFTEVDEDYSTSVQDEEYGIGYDCPPVPNMYNLVSTVAGGSITAAKCLLLGIADVAINWCGGWHHAQRFGADGFCYVNDIVLAIEKLRQKFPKVLYVDLDVHHGNGVQDAYNLSKSVFTLSIHKYEPGFYPGTGGVDDIGTFAGKGNACNVPLRESYSDDSLEYVFGKVITPVYSLFNPDAVVMQCGADALAHDPHGGANLTIQGYLACVRTVLDKRKPTLLLGGGGYKHPNAARLWTSITALTTGVTLDDDIPEHSHWMRYGPDYTLAVEPSLARDTNKKNYLDESLSIILGNLEKYLGNDDNEVETEPGLKKRKTELESKDISTFKNVTEERSPDFVKQNLELKNVLNEGNVKNKENVIHVENDVYAFTDE